MKKRIGGIGNYYGHLFVKNEDGKSYFGIENWNGIYWEPITEKLYKELIRHEMKLRTDQHLED